MNSSKLLNWSVSVARLANLNIVFCFNISWPRCEKHVYIRRSAKFWVTDDGFLKIGQGETLRENRIIQVNTRTEASFGDFFKKSNSHVIAVKSAKEGDRLLYGTDVCVYDHNYVVRHNRRLANPVSAPVAIGTHCWTCVNSIVIKGVTVVSSVTIGGAVVTRLLTEVGPLLRSSFKNHLLPCYTRQVCKR